MNSFSRSIFTACLPRCEPVHLNELHSTGQCSTYRGPSCSGLLVNCRSPSVLDSCQVGFEAQHKSDLVTRF